MKNYLKPFKSKKYIGGIGTVVSSVGFFLATTESVFASSTGDFKQTVQQTSDDFAADLKFYGTIIAGVAILIAFIMFMLGARAREKAKDWLQYIVIGVVGILIGGSIIGYIIGLFQR